MSLYPNILDLPFSRTEPSNSGLMELLATSNPNSGQISGLNSQYGLQYASPISGSNPAQLLYSGWLGTTEPKNTSQLFGLQGKKFN